MTPTAGWKDALPGEKEKPYFRELMEFVTHERERYQVFPPERDVFNALKFTSYEQTKVLILGQDPYHDVGQAHGLAFSVRPGVRPPPSLLNIFRELHDDVGVPMPKSGSLTGWAEQGVLLLNAVLTVRAHQPGSHQGKGWETFTDAVITALNNRERPVVFVLWGNSAKKKLELIDAKRHPVLTGPHPSPLSASRGFFGSKPFSKINAHLRALGQDEIDWRLE